ncbi:MAG: hypothetical protein ACYTEK_12180 [Planctomycetota bacterium]|jgi:hypothetical protein
MTLKEFWAQTGRWLRVHNPLAQTAPQPEIGEDGLISLDSEPDAARVEGVPPSNRGQDARDTSVVVRATPPADRQDRPTGKSRSKNSSRASTSLSSSLRGLTST